MVAGSLRAGVLALQGDVAEHRRALAACGAAPLEVRTREDLEAVDALVIPGGESTTMLKLIDRYELRDPLVKRIEAGMPTFGICAGAILLASRTSDGEPPLGVLDLTVHRNAYGRQRESFEAEVDMAGVGVVPAVFIRAPVFEEPGPGLEVLATWAGCPVAVRSGNVLAIAFHPELAGTLALHRYFLEDVAARSEGVA